MSQTVYRIQGRDVRLPVCVRQASSIASMYLVPSAAVRRLVSHPDLQIPEIWPGRSLCVIALIDYVDNDLGDYNEISIGFFVQQGQRRPSRWGSLPVGLARGTAHAYSHRLPVNQGFTCEAGQTIWAQLLLLIGRTDIMSERRAFSWNKFSIGILIQLCSRACFAF